MIALIPPVHCHDHIQGLETAAITLVEYGDYQSPRCVDAHYIIQEIQQQLGDRLRFVFRHFPRTDLHPQAQQAAEAAEAAAGQGKFWQMHHHLFKNYHALGNGHLVEYAIALNLDVMRFLQEMSGDVYSQRVQEDINSGIRSGVTCTPTFFINQVRYDDSWEKAILLSALTQLLD